MEKGFGPYYYEMSRLVVLKLKMVDGMILKHMHK